MLQKVKRRKKKQRTNLIEWGLKHKGVKSLSNAKSDIPAWQYLGANGRRWRIKVTVEAQVHSGEYSHKEHEKGENSQSYKKSEMKKSEDS